MLNNQSPGYTISFLVAVVSTYSSERSMYLEVVFSKGSCNVSSTREEPKCIYFPFVIVAAVAANEIIVAKTLIYVEQLTRYLLIL